MKWTVESMVVQYDLMLSYATATATAKRTGRFLLYSLQYTLGYFPTVLVMTATVYVVQNTHQKVVVHYDLMLSSHMVPCSPAPIHAPTKAVSVPICDCHPFAVWCSSSGANVHQKFWCKDLGSGANAHQMIQGNATLPLSAHFPTHPLQPQSNT